MTQTQVVKVFTPIKRVPMVIGKAQNGQKLPFGPYTLPQVAGVAVSLLLTSVAAMTLPANPAITFLIGLAFTIVVGFGLGLIPYTGVRLLSRVLWIGRLIVYPKPVSASGMPVTPESGRLTSFIEESVAVILPARDPSTDTEGPATPFLQQFERRDDRAADSPDASSDNALSSDTAPAFPTSSNWRSMVTGNGSNISAIRERATNGVQE